MCVYYIAFLLVDMNPAANDVYTPLHLAAENGHTSVCQLIIDNVQEKNPMNRYENTPLHSAAVHGHFETFKMLFDRAEDKNTIYPMAPLHFAAWKGHFEIAKLIVDNVQDKNPVIFGNDHCLKGKTALQIAALFGQYQIAYYIQSKL